MSAADVVLPLVGACVLARAFVSLRRISRGVAAAREELLIWRRHHPGHHHRRHAQY